MDFPETAVQWNCKKADRAILRNVRGCFFSARNNGKALRVHVDGELLSVGKTDWVIFSEKPHPVPRLASGLMTLPPNGLYVQRVVSDAEFNAELVEAA